MIDASRYVASDHLRNGLPVTIRAIRPSDKEAVREAFDGLEGETIYMRFLSHRRELTKGDLRRVTEIDFVSEVGLVACVETPAGRDRIIGGGRYFVTDPSASMGEAEVAFVVEEDFQGLGLAGRLLHHLAVIAKTRGIRAFHAVTLSDNRSMLRVFERSRYPLTQKWEDGMLHVKMSLQ